MNLLAIDKLHLGYRPGIMRTGSDLKTIFLLSTLNGFSYLYYTVQVYLSEGGIIHNRMGCSVTISKQENVL